MSKSGKEKGREGTDDIDQLNSSPERIPEREEARSRAIDTEIVILIAELLEVALHTILCIRQVYPIQLFKRRVKLGIPVFQCIDPSINEYISEVVRSVGEEIVEDRVARVIINIHRADTLLEKFIFSFYTEKCVRIVPVADADILPLDTVRRYTRGMLIKLNAIDAQLVPLVPPDDLSFSIVMQLRGANEFRVSKRDLDFDAIQEGKGGEEEDVGCNFRDPDLVHIIRAGGLSVYLHVQESEAKERGTSALPSQGSREV